MNRRNFLQATGAMIVGIALAPFAPKPKVIGKVYGGVYFRSDGVKVYTGAHYDRIDVMPGDRVVLASTVETVGELNVLGGWLMATENDRPTQCKIGTVNIVSGRVGFVPSETRFCVDFTQDGCIRTHKVEGSVRGYIGSLNLMPESACYQSMPIKIDLGSSRESVTVYNPTVFGRNISRRTAKMLHNASLDALS